MYTVLLGVVLSTGAQAQGNVYFGYPGYGYYGGGCYCAPYYAVPVAYPVAVPVVASRSEAEKTIANLRKRLKTLEEKFAQTEPQVKLTREALMELAGKVDKLDDHIKTTEPQFLQMLKEMNGRINGIEDTIKTKEPLVKAKLDELADRMKGVEGSIKGLEDATKPALRSLSSRVKKVETTLKKQEDDKKQAALDNLADQVKKLQESLSDRVKKVEDTLKEKSAGPGSPSAAVPPAPQANGLRSSLDHFIDRLKKVDVEMRDDAKVDAILDRLSRVEGALGADQQKLQSAIDALRSFSENVDKGFMSVNSRLRVLEDSQAKAPPVSKEPEIKKEPELKNEEEPKKVEEFNKGEEPRKTPEPKKDAAEDGFGFVPPPPTAMLIISVPAEAKVFLNGQATRSTGRVRSFNTPNLETGKNYSYEVRAELTRDGQTVTETRQVTFQAGGHVSVSFADLGDSSLTKLRTVRAH